MPLSWSQRNPMADPRISWAPEIAAEARSLASSSAVWWQSRKFAKSDRLRAALEGRRPINLTVTTLGGSASAFTPNYGSFLAEELQQELSSQRVSVRCINPSHGYTGSDWAALFMDSLVPPDTDVLIWEFAVNDWPGHRPVVDKEAGTARWPGLRAATWHEDAFHLYIRRALALMDTRRVALGFVFLWQPEASRCFPSCAVCRACPPRDPREAPDGAPDGAPCPWRVGASPTRARKNVPNASGHVAEVAGSSSGLRATAASEHRQVECVDDGLLWRDNLRVLERYADRIDAFALNVNELLKGVVDPHANPLENGRTLDFKKIPVRPSEPSAKPLTKRWRPSAADVFSDATHPWTWVHRTAGCVLSRHLLSQRNARSHPSRNASHDVDVLSSDPQPPALSPVTPSMPPPLQASATRTHQQAPEQLKSLAKSSRFRSTGEELALLAALDDTSVQAVSYFYGDPRFGPNRLACQSAEAGNVRQNGGKPTVQRVDNVRHVPIPLCNADANVSTDGGQGTGALRYTMRLAPDRTPLFIGINLRGQTPHEGGPPAGYSLIGALDKLEEALRVQLHRGDIRPPQRLLALPKQALESGKAATICRGIFAPQAWFAVPQPVPVEERSRGSHGQHGQPASLRAAYPSSDDRAIAYEVSICRRRALPRSLNDSDHAIPAPPPAAAVETTADAVIVAAHVGGLVVLVG